MQLRFPLIGIVTDQDVTKVDLRTGQVSLVGVQEIVIGRTNTDLLEKFLLFHSHALKYFTRINNYRNSTSLILLSIMK